jgi:hypothetical protein
LSKVHGAVRFFSKYRDLWICLALFTVTVATYWPVHANDFIGLDDDEYVADNIHVRNGFTLANVKWAFTSVRYAANWHPLTWLSHMLDCELFGLDPGRHHIINVAFHAASVVALFLALRRMTGAPWRSGFVSALFALHPLHVESVAWVAERKDVLSGLFWMGTMWAYAIYAVQRSLWRYGLVLVLFALGLMAKPMLVTLPCVLLLLDWWPLKRFEREQWSFLFLEKIPMLLLSAVCSFLTLQAQRPFALIPVSALPITVRLQHSVAALMVYLEKTFWPKNLAVYYPFSSVWPQWTILPSTAFLLAISVLLIWQARRRPWLSVGWFWFLGTLVPVIGLAQVGTQGRADRYTYIPLIGLFMAVTWESDQLGRAWRFGRPALAAVAGIILLACVCASAHQISYWKDDLTLFSHAAEATRDNVVAQDVGATALGKRGETAEAIRHWEIAFQMSPGYASSHANMAEMLARHKRFVEAIVQFKVALELSPNDFDTESKLASIYATVPGHVDSAAAVRLAESACESAGYDWPEYLNTLAAAYASAGRFDEAIATAEKAARIARESGEIRLPEQIEQRLSLYRQQQPYREAY